MLDRTARRVTAVTAVALLGASATAVPAHAAHAASTAGRNVVTSASWGAVPTVASAPPYGPGPLTMSFARSNNPPPQYLNAVNTGSLALAQATYDLTVTTGGVGAVLESCSTTWDETTHLCLLGTVGTVTSSTAPTASTTVPVAPAEARRLRVRLTARPATPTATTSLSISVSRAQAAPATRSSS